MAYTVRDLSNAQRFEYKGYEVFMHCVEDSFWSGERTYKADISISDHIYYRIAEEIGQAAVDVAVFVTICTAKAVLIITAPVWILPYAIWRKGRKQ